MHVKAGSGTGRGFGRLRKAARYLRSRPLLTAAGVCALALLAVLGAVLHYQLAPYHFLGVEEGVLYRSGTLRPGNLRSVLDDYGVRTVVNLRSVEENAEPWHDAQQRICKELGVTLVDMPMPFETPPTPEQIEEWLGLLADPARRPILVHCQHGVVRTGMMVGLFEAAHRGRTGPEILETLPMFGHRLWAPHRKPMRDFILGLEGGAKAAAE